jgi:endoglycosylceramidase
VLGGSGAPAWALPDPNVTPTPPDSFFWFGRYKSDPNVLAAFEHFWGNGRGVQDAFIGTAEFLAGELKDFPNLFGFDLFNEPSPGASKKDDLGAFFEQDLAPFYQRTAAALRRADPRFVVLAGPTGLESFESTTVMKRPDVQNLVFSPHYYDTIVTATRHYSPADSLPAGKIASWNDVGKDWNAPMLISEYGPLQVMDNPGRFLDDLYAAFDKMFVHGTYWTHEISAERWNKEDAGLVDGNWVERTAFTDAFSRPFPACTSGEPAEFVFDRANKQVSFKWSAGDCGGAPTVVKLPARHFPKTPSVELSSGEWKYDGGRHELLVFDRVCEGKTAKGAVQTLKIMP